MGEGKGSTLVHLLVVVLSLVAFGFAIAAERQRSVVSRLYFSFRVCVLSNFTVRDVINFFVLNVLFSASLCLYLDLFFVFNFHDSVFCTVCAL